MVADLNQWSAAEQAEIERHLERLVASTSLAQSLHLQQLLRYLITESLTGRGGQINQTSIAIDVLGRDAHFDPSVDSLVRVEAGRLRSKLREYYYEEGKADTIRFALPKGHYVPQITFTQIPEATADEPDALTEPLPADVEAARSPLLFRHRALGVLIFGLFTSALLVVALDQSVWVDDKLAPPGTAINKTSDETTRTIVVQRPKSVAVLPFTNHSAAGEETAFFADGLHDDLLTQLSKIADLRVISRTSVMRYRNTTIAIPQIAAELNVVTILEGDVQQAGDRVRINVRLIDAQTDENLWSESFDRELNTANIFAIQRDIVTKTAATLQSTLTPAEQARLATLPTKSLAAYEAYLKGRQQYRKRNVKGFTAAIALFQHAIDSDPGFALAYIGLAESYALIGNYGGEDMLAKAKPLVERALALDDQLGEAYTALGLLRFAAHDYDGAKLNFERAIQLNPGDAQTYRWYAELLGGRFNEHEKALALMQRAVMVDPLSSTIRASLAEGLALQDRPDEALAQYRKALELDPGDAFTYSGIGALYATAYAQPVEAARWIHKAVALSPDLPFFGRSIALFYFMRGDFDTATQWMENLRNRGYRFDANMICALLEQARGEDDAAAACAREAPYWINVVRVEMLFILRNADIRAGRFPAARARYAQWYPGLLQETPDVNRDNFVAAIDLALVLQKLGQSEQPDRLLQQALLTVRTRPRFAMDAGGYGISDVEIHALRGEKAQALAAMRRAIDAGWENYWFRVPQQNPNLALLQGDTQFASMLAEVKAKLAKDLEKIRDMQRRGEIERIAPVAANTD